MRFAFLVLTAALTMTGCATTPPPSELPTVQINLPPPEACTRACPELPEPFGAEEWEIGMWTLNVIEAAGTCRRLHDACRLTR